MAIDLNSCVGLQTTACWACQSENNIAVVGKEQAVIGRHMHWIRVDAYYQATATIPRRIFQPVPCSCSARRPLRSGVPGGRD